MRTESVRRAVGVGSETGRRTEQEEWRVKREGEWREGREEATASTCIPDSNISGSFCFWCS